MPQTVQQIRYELLQLSICDLQASEKIRLDFRKKAVLVGEASKRALFTFA